jgi:hypothetical protein
MVLPSPSVLTLVILYSAVYGRRAAGASSIFAALLLTACPATGNAKTVIAANTPRNLPRIIHLKPKTSTQTV